MKICPLRVFYLCVSKPWQTLRPTLPPTSQHLCWSKGTRARKQSGEKPQLWLAINLLNGGGWKWRHETLRWSWFAVLRLLGIPRCTLWYLWVLLQALQVKSKLHERWRDGPPVAASNSFTTCTSRLKATSLIWSPPSKDWWVEAKFPWAKACHTLRLFLLQRWLIVW